jgi:hypothetical protein
MANTVTEVPKGKNPVPEQVGPRFCFICLDDSGTRKKQVVDTEGQGARYVCYDPVACRASVVDNHNKGVYK